MSFKSWASYWQFSQSVRNKSRYVLDCDSQDFLKGIKDTCTSRVMIIPPSSELYRAQMGHNTVPLMQDNIEVDNKFVPYPESRMRPLKDSAQRVELTPREFLVYMLPQTEKLLCQRYALG